MVEKALDFSPFDAEENLSAVNSVLRAVRHMSWSYAGDISRVVKKIAQTFDAGRCILFASKEGGKFDVYEFVEGETEALAGYFNSEDGQGWLNSLVDRGDDFISTDTFIQLAETEEGFSPQAKLLEPTSHIIPLKNPYTSRYGIKPGFMLVQEPRSLLHWNKKQLNSLIIVAEYLAMTIECERLTSAMHIETTLGARVPGILTRRRFSDLAEWELSKASSLNLKPVFVLFGFPERTKLSLPQLIRDADLILESCANALLEAKSPLDLAGYWRGDLMVALSSSGGDKFISDLKDRVQGAFKDWALVNGIASTPEGIPAFGVAKFPQDGKSLEALYQSAHSNSTLSA